MSDKPAWMDNPAADSENPQRALSSSSTALAAPEGEVPYKGVAVTTLYVMNMGSAVFTAAVGALGIGSAGSINDTGLIFVGLYLIIFAALVFLFELAQILKWEKFDEFMKKNFGFLYGVIGKSVFLLMIGILCFGLGKPKPLTTVCGVLVCAWAFAQVLIFFKFPDYFDPKVKYQP